MSLRSTYIKIISNKTGVKYVVLNLKKIKRFVFVQKRIYELLIYCKVYLSCYADTNIS